jgi:hypothetical protein
MSAHPAYIPGCRHDVFVSYAWVDNQPPYGELTTNGGLTPGWVHALADYLKSQLSVHLGRQDWGDIWIDRRIDATSSITAEEDAVRGSALMLVILSEGYLASPWYEHERELFERERKADGGTVELEERRLMLPPAPQPPAGEALILIRAAESDEDTACRIGDKLYDDHRVGYEVVADRDTPMADLVLDAPYQGLMVIYDTVDRDWARTQVKECRAIALDRKDRAPVCAVYDEPRPHKRPLGIRFPRFHFLQALAGPEFTGLLQALGAAVGGAGV